MEPIRYTVKLERVYLIAELLCTRGYECFLLSLLAYRKIVKALTICKQYFHTSL